MRKHFSFFIFILNCVSFCILCFLEVILASDLTLYWASGFLLQNCILSFLKTYENVMSLHTTIVCFQNKVKSLIRNIGHFSIHISFGTVLRSSYLSLAGSTIDIQVKFLLWTTDSCASFPTLLNALLTYS